MVHVNFEGTGTERLGNITGDIAAETLRSSWTRYYGRPDDARSASEGCFSSNVFKERLAAMNVTFLPVPGEAAWRIGILDNALGALKESAAKAARRLKEDVSIQEIFDMCCEAHNDLSRLRGSSLLHLLIGRTRKGFGLEAERSLGQRSAELTDIVERSRLEVETECYTAYVEEELTLQQKKPSIRRGNGELGHRVNGDGSGDHLPLTANEHRKQEYFVDPFAY